MEVSGVIHNIGEEVQVSASFRKRELVVKTEEQYPQFISINFVQDKCDLIDPYAIGELVKVHINLRGREWVNPQGEAKYFNDIQGWRIEKMNQDSNSTPAPSTQTNPREYPQSAMTNSFVDEPKGIAPEEDHDDLPF